MGISLGNALSGAASALTNAAGGNQAGIAQGNQISQGNMLDALQLARQQAQDQLARQSAQSRMSLEAAQANEAGARAKAVLAPPPKGSVIVGPNQQAIDTATGQAIATGPSRVDPAVEASTRNAASLAAHDAAQQNQIAATAKNAATQAAAKEYTDALTGYQQVEAANPSIKSPLATKLTGWATGAPEAFSANETQAKARVKAAWQAYKAAGGTPGDIPELGLVSTPGAAPAPAGTQPSAKAIVHAAIHGQPLD